MSAMPSLQLHDAQIASCFADRNDGSAKKLASLINKCTPNSLDTIFEPILQQVYFSSFNQIADIDSLLQFLSSVAGYIDPDLKHDGTEETPYLQTNLRPSLGPAILAERLSHYLFRSLSEHVSRGATPDQEGDAAFGLKYYQDAAAYGTILARGFATQPDLFRDHLWREVEDVFVKGLFTSFPEPGAYVILAALFLGAGKEIKVYLDEGHVGQGTEWVWYFDVRSKPDNTWDWPDVATAFARTEVEWPEVIPDSVKSSFMLAKEVIGRGQHIDSSWDSSTLAETAFHWIS